MKKTGLTIVFSLALTLLFSSTALAQNNNSEYKQTLKKMLQKSGSIESYHNAIDQYIQMYKKQKPSVSDTVWIEMKKAFKDDAIEQLVKKLTPVYKKYLTQSDLEGIIEFYNTSIGEKYAKYNPKIMEESMQVGQEWGRELREKLKKKLNKKGY